MARNKSKNKDMSPAEALRKDKAHIRNALRTAKVPFLDATSNMTKEDVKHAERDLLRVLTYVQAEPNKDAYENKYLASEKKYHEKHPEEFSDTQYTETNESYEIENNDEPWMTSHMNASPREIYNKFDEKLYGCDDYKKGLSIFLWKILHGHKPEGALLVAGQSGSGKTEAIRILEKIYPNVRMIDGTRLTNEGFKGGCKIGSEIGQLIDDSQDYPEYPPILVIDEFDKVVFTSEKHETNYCAPPIIPEIYKVIEGCKITVEMGRNDTRTFDTKNVVFILMGSFSSYAKPSQSLLGFGGDAIKLKHDERMHMPTKDEILAALPAEMRGRTEDVIYVPELLKEDFREILDDDRYSPLLRLGKKYGIEISADNAYKDFIAEQAYAEGTGVRELNTRIMRELNAALFDNLSIAKLHLTLNGSKITSKSDALDIELYEEVVNQMANDFINQHCISNKGEDTP